MTAVFVDKTHATLRCGCPEAPALLEFLMTAIISVSKVSKTYAAGFRALKCIDLEIQRGEIFALLGPNGAGKSTLINIICGIVNPSSGSITVDCKDIVADYRAVRSMIGLVPQELATDMFETVWATVNFSRGLFGKRPDPAYIEKVLKELTLWEKKDSKILTLSGGMKRRLLIAKALAHEPQILFLDEPTAGVDVELRREMWNIVRTMRDYGVTIILTTHYIEEAEEMADRVGVIANGEIILVEDKVELMRKLGKKQLVLQLQAPLSAIPPGLEFIRSAAYRRRQRADLHLRHTCRTDRHYGASERHAIGGAVLQGPEHDAEFARRYFRRPSEPSTMNVQAVRAIYGFEMSRWGRTLMQSIVSPVLSTSLYFIVFGAAIGSRISTIDGVSYGSFIVPGLVMLLLLTESTSNASFGIYFPRFTGTIYEHLSAPVSPFEIVLGYVGAAATKSGILGLIILATASLFVSVRIAHPLWMLAFLVLTAVTFSMFGFILGVWADGFERLQVVPLLVLTPLTFLGGTFYSIKMLPPLWQTVTLFNPIVYLISGFRWSFYEISDVNVGMSLLMTLGFLVACLAVIWWIFKTGYRLKA